MFNFCIKYLWYLKFVPGFPHVFDAMLRMEMAFTRPAVLRYIDEIEEEVLGWEGACVTLHKLGGIQFNIHGKEIGHIHSNGLLDILFSKEMKMALIREGKAAEHHSYKDSGWTSFFIRSENDRQSAIALLACSMQLKNNTSAAPAGH
jgi:hypothetical protein